MKVCLLQIYSVTILDLAQKCAGDHRKIHSMVVSESFDLGWVLDYRERPLLAPVKTGVPELSLSGSIFWPGGPGSGGFWEFESRLLLTGGPILHLPACHFAR